MSNDNFDIEWIDGGRPPQAPPNPAFPKGVRIDGADHHKKWCRVGLPYPTGHVNIGRWAITCRTCRMKMIVTAASRPDDPRSITVNCVEGKQ